MRDTEPSSAFIPVIEAIRINQLDKNDGLIDYAITHDNKNIDFLFKLAIACAQDSRLNDALIIFQKIFPFKKNDFLFFYNYGLIFSIQGKHHQAIEMYNNALILNPNDSDTLANIGSSLTDLGRNEEGLFFLDQALKNNSQIAEAWANRAVVLTRFGQHDEAVESYAMASKIKNKIDYLPGDLIYSKMKICAWNDLEGSKKDIIKGIEAGLPVIKPFTAIALFDSESLHRQVAEIYSKISCPAISERQINNCLFSGRKIRIGYFSADFHNHATLHLMAEFFELHDKNKFEIIAFSFGPNVKDGLWERVSKVFDQFIEVKDKTDREISLLSRRLNIDIAIDLKGYTKDSRPGIFCIGAAPIQINYLGYPGTIGVGTLDYVIADKTVIPESSQAQFSEKIIYLPNSYQINDTQRPISDKVFSRNELGLPESAFVYCCFNNNYKILPETFSSWMRILNSVDGSVLWLLEDNPWAANNLKKAAQIAGINSDRIVFAKRASQEDHLSRHRAADLFLDTHPYNAHTTASDALWAGLPILTIVGGAFAGRVCASLLRAAGLPELITETRDQYEKLAIELAKNPKKLLALKERLAQNRLTKPLFDTITMTKQIESAYQMVFKRFSEGLSPENISL